MRGLNDGRTISDAAFGMFRATVEETESTSPYEVGVGGLEKSLHVEREAAEVEHATVGASRGAGGRGTGISASACSPTRWTEVSGSLTPSSYGKLLSFSSPVNHNMPNAAPEIVGPCSKLSTLRSRPTNGISGLDSWIIYISFSTWGNRKSLKSF